MGWGHSIVQYSTVVIICYSFYMYIKFIERLKFLKRQLKKFPKRLETK